MKMLQSVIDAWKNAEDELGIEIQTPFNLDGTEFPFLVSSFGSSKGALPLLIGANEHLALAQHAGYFATQLNPDRYCIFRRELFIDTLNDWQWFGLGVPPDLYSGKSWG